MRRIVTGSSKIRKPAGIGFRETRDSTPMHGGVSMGLFDQVRKLFGRPPGPYEAAQKERVEAIRGAVEEGGATLEFLRAMVALISEAKEEEVKGESHLLEDLQFGDVEMMELELLCEDLFEIELSGAELNLVDTLSDLATLIDRKKGEE
jgi:acyl carrier protein